MFKRHSEAEINRLMRESWLQTKARGKNRFILREMLASLPIWLVAVFAVPAIEASASHAPFWVRSIWFGRWTVFGDLILLAIFLLGGYLTGRWRWTDLEKKYPENNLPPWK
jgi:hypothetical protein